MLRHTGADGFVQPCLLPGRTLLLPTKHGWLGQRYVTTVVSAPRGDHLPLRATRYFLLVRITGGFCHAYKTVPRQDVSSHFTPCVCHLELKNVIRHTRDRDSRGSAAACLGHALGTPSWPSHVVLTIVLSRLYARYFRGSNKQYRDIISILSSLSIEFFIIREIFSRN